MVDILERVIRDRRTVKVLADEPLAADTDRGVVEAIVANAGWAPFHKVSASIHQDGSTLTSVAPWRCYLLDAAACRSLREWLLSSGEGGAMPRLLAASSALVMVTWLPNPPSQEEAESDRSFGSFEPTLDNMEHIAAAAAAVQNMVLSATARGLRTFWATANPVRNAAGFKRLGIPAREVLLGAVYLFPSESGDVETKFGSQRDRRGEPREWSRWVELEG